VTEIRIANRTFSPTGEWGRWVLTNGWVIHGQQIPSRDGQPATACYSLWAPGEAVEVGGAAFLGGGRELPALLTLAGRLAGARAARDGGTP
jgi:hypothetical protein